MSSNTFVELNTLKRRGTALLLCIIIMMVLIAFVSLAIDFGRLQLARVEMFGSAEDVARYAAAGIVSGTVATRASSALADNQCVGGSSGITPADVETGIWDTFTSTFTPTSIHPNAVKVNALRTRQRSNAVPLVFGPSVGISDCDLHACAIAYYNMNAMLVVGNVTLNASDQLAYNRLASLGYHVVVEADVNVTSDSVKYMRFVVISESVVSSAINTKLKSVNVPIVCYEPFLVDDFQMAGAVSGTDYGLSMIASRIVIDAPTHPVAQGLTGTVTVSTMLDGSTEEYLAWAKIAPGGVKVASLPGYATRSSIYAFDKGATLLDGTSAPARRIGFFGSGPLGGFLNGVTADKWTADGWKVFDNACRWAAGPNPDIATVRLSR